MNEPGNPRISEIYQFAEGGKPDPEEVYELRGEAYDQLVLDAAEVRRLNTKNRRWGNVGPFLFLAPLLASAVVAYEAESIDTPEKGAIVLGGFVLGSLATMVGGFAEHSYTARAVRQSQASRDIAALFNMPLDREIRQTLEQSR